MPPFAAGRRKPQGVPGSVCDGSKEAIVPTATRTSTPSYRQTSTNTGVLSRRGRRRRVRASYEGRPDSSPCATYAGIDTWLTDFATTCPRSTFPFRLHGPRPRPAVPRPQWRCAKRDCRRQTVSRSPPARTTSGGPTQRSEPQRARPSWARQAMTARPRRSTQPPVSDVPSGRDEEPKTSARLVPRRSFDFLPVGWPGGRRRC